MHTKALYRIRGNLNIEFTLNEINTESYGIVVKKNTLSK